MTKAQQQLLEKQLWKIANELRGNMNADEFRDYILGFVFLNTCQKSSIFLQTSCLKLSR